MKLLRLLGVTLFFGLVLYEEVLKRAGHNGGYAELLAGYWLLSIAIFAGGCVSDRLTQLSSLAIPVLDVPLVFLIQFGVMMDSANPRAVANFTLGVYVVVVMLAATTLRGWEILVTGAIAVIAQLVFSCSGPFLAVQVSASCNASQERG